MEVKPVFQNTDIMILVAGITGAGKSTFINALLKGECVPVNHKLTSLTQELRCEIIPPGCLKDDLKDRRLIIVDTPGFNQTFEDDTKVLLQIADWLSPRCVNGITLGGVLYLHDISLQRYSAVTEIDLLALRKSFATGTDKRVAFVTTKWQRVPESEGIERETELKDTFWKGLIDHGSEVHHFEHENDHENAWKAVNALLAGNHAKFNILQPLENLRKNLDFKGNKSKDFFFSVLEPLFGLFARPWGRKTMAGRNRY